MAEVEDVAGAGPVGGLGEHRPRGRLDHRPRCQAQRGVEVALQRVPGTDARGAPRRGGPANRRRPRRNRPSPSARAARRCRRRRGWWARRDRRWPRARPGWRAGRSARTRRERASPPSCRRAAPPGPRLRSVPVSEATAIDTSRSVSCPHSRRIAVHQGLDLGEGARRAPFDEVAGHGERRTGKPDERHPRPVELTAHQAHGLGDVGGVDVGLERTESAQVVAAAEGLGDHGTPAGLHVDPEADGLNGHDDVGEQDGGVDAVAPHRLEGQLGGQRRRPQWPPGWSPRPGPPGTRAATGRPGA